jgi:next-to-BRCA1 protein 1
MRREALKQRVAHIKANILKTREEREKLTEELSQREVHQQTEKPIADKKATDNDKVQKIVDEVVKNAEEDVQPDVAAEEGLSDSQMVFPKLDKESPASSLYGSATSGSSKAKAAYVENEDGEVERAAVPASVAGPAASVSSAPDDDNDFVDLDDELEVLSASADESDDGFLTDEEYDILDASDSETVASGWRS